MDRINTNELRPGMILGMNVYSSNGRLLLEEGVEIGESSLRILNIWGVLEVCVRTRREADACEERACPFLAIAEEYVAQKFALHGVKHPELQELLRQCVLDYQRRMTEGWRPFAFNFVDAPFEPTPPSLEALTTTDKDLASLPDVYFQIDKALKDPACTSARLADIISKDTGMSAKLLRLVNSSALGQSRKVDTLSRGVVILGIKEISLLALGVSIMSKFDKVSSQQLPMKAFWRHSLSCGVMARLLAVQLQRRDAERFFIAGMLHDIGRLAMLKLAPMATARAIRVAYEQRISLQEAELRVFGYDHCLVAQKLMELWKFPDTLTNLIAYHHTPSQSNAVQEVAILHVANEMVIALEYGHSGQHYCMGFEQAAWISMNLSPSVFAVLISQAQRQIDDIITTFLG